MRVSSPFFSLLSPRLKTSLLLHISSPNSEKCESVPFSSANHSVFAHNAILLPDLELPSSSLSKGPFPLVHKTVHSSPLFQKIPFLIIMMTTVKVSIYRNLRARHHTKKQRNTEPFFHFIFSIIQWERFLNGAHTCFECHSLFPYQVCKKSSNHQC